MGISYPQRARKILDLFKEKGAISVADCGGFEKGDTWEELLRDGFLRLSKKGTIVSITPKGKEWPKIKDDSYMDPS